MRLSRLWGLILTGCLATGCELIATFDLNKVTTGTGGDGGATGGGGMGGITNPTTGWDDPMCIDPATDCTEPLSGECKMWGCDASGICVEQGVSDNMDAETQTSGDCKKNVCMGGASMSQNDDTDTLDDGNECTVDFCNAGSPQSDPAAAGAPCSMNGGKVCDGAAACVECLMDADCTDPLEPKCHANQCFSAECNDSILNGDETDVDCGGACQGCDTGQSCDNAADCYHGVCNANNKCAAPACNDNVRNGGDYLMNNGETDVDCGGPCGATCGPMKSCDENGDCVGNQCTGMGGTCVPNCQDQVQNNVETDVDCGGGTCGGCAVGEMCGNDDDNCVSTAYCDNGTCAAKKDNGTVCGGNNQCTSAFCVDMVCCNVACSGTCQSCSLAGNRGTCSFVDAGTDPANECSGNGGADVCDGAGMCLEANGTSCSNGSECASGFCADGVCCDQLCDGLCQACSVAKTGGTNGTCGKVTANTDPNSECSGSLDCNGSGACEAKLTNGSPCTVAGECSSNQCVDGVCCNNACSGTCSACSAALKGSGPDGTCGPIANNTDPQNECAGALDCNGASACESAQADGSSCTVAGECSSGFCVDNVCCNTACSGTCQACSAAKIGAGGVNGTCDDIENNTDPDNECAMACDGNGACQ